jgi:AdoMet-dependent heme synthase
MTNNKHPQGHGQGRQVPRVLAVEVTRRCNLDCIHCRAAASCVAPEGELSLAEYGAFFENVASFASPIVILTGGEPLLREDIFEIGAAATGLGLRTALSTNGTLVTGETAQRMLESGIHASSISIDGSTAAIHDDFRQQQGAFDASLAGMKIFQDAGIKVQVNSSLTRRNMDDLEAVFELVRRVGADAWHLFLLVPTGRGGEAADRELIGADDYERILNRVYEWNRDEEMEIKPTCAPQYYRILRQRARAEGIPVDEEHFGLNARTRGCLAGMGFGFVSYCGEVFPCGYYPKLAGRITTSPFRTIWEESELFTRLRDFKAYEGACGRCRFLRFCGGCRARALAIRGNDFAEEPYCSFGAGEML